MTEETLQHAIRNLSTYTSPISLAGAEQNKEAPSPSYSQSNAIKSPNLASGSNSQRATMTSPLAGVIARSPATHTSTPTEAVVRTSPPTAITPLFSTRNNSDGYLQVSDNQVSGNQVSGSLFWSSDRVNMNTSPIPGEWLSAYLKYHSAHQSCMQW